MLASLSLAQLAYAATVIAVAYVVRGIAGFGSGLVSIPLLALILPLPVVVPTISVLDYLASITHGTRHRRAIRWRDLLPLLPFTLVGVLSALYLFKTVDADLLRRAFGVFIILYALYSLKAEKPVGGGSRLWAAPAGGLGGLIGTLFGTGGPFYVIYMSLRGLEKTAFRATIATVFMIDGGARLTGYLASGFYSTRTLLLIASGLPIMATGLYVGGHIHTNITQKRFQQAIGLLLIGSGIALLIK